MTPGRHAIARVRAAAAAVALMTLAVSCNNSPSPGNTSQVDGHYNGGGTGVQAISFDVSGNGATISNLRGTVVVNCAAGSASSNNHLGFTDGNTITTSSLAFDDSYHAGTGYTLGVKGSLDGHGAATGSLHWTNGSCDAAANGDPWVATLQGVSPPPLPSSQSQSAASCSPQPCGVSGDVTLVVQDITPLAPINDTIPVDISVTFTSNAHNDTSIDASSDMKLQPSQGNPVTPGRNVTLTDADGNPISCMAFLKLPAGQTESDQDVCFLVPESEISQTFTLWWHPASYSDHGSTIQLGALPTS